MLAFLYVNFSLRSWSELTYKAVNSSELSKLVLISIMLFNRRRAGEAQRVTGDNFKSGCSVTIQDDIQLSLSPIEQSLLSKLKRIEIRGKRGRKVPLLLRPIHFEALNLLVTNRDNAGVDENNIYLFPRTANGVLTPLDACAVMRTVTKKAALKHPHLLRSTKLRKQIGTFSQLLNLSQNELEQLCNFMGHRFDIHLDFYRLPSDVVQIAKVGKILLAAEDGIPLKQQNCTPDSLTFNNEGNFTLNFFKRCKHDYIN